MAFGVVVTGFGRAPERVTLGVVVTAVDRSTLGANR